ncbi:IclR family transcriptional regulator [Marinobacter sp. M1N3S26]|uniref:IclR family transcriptional regulator n=1 Tax=Marinobacter sp. M1N3S26 TaxID=3382299 RepID=UPI00387B7CD0
MTTSRDHQTASRREKGSSILRVLDILHHVCTAEKATPLPELIAELNIPKATAHRLVQQLEEQRFFQTNMRGNLVPGPAMRAIALGVMNSNEIKVQRQAILQGLSHRIDETCGISIPDGTEMIYYDRVQANWPLQVHLPIGSHVPIWGSASGKLYLARLPKATRRRVLRNLPLVKLARNTIVDADQLEEELEQIRQTDLGIDNEEFIDGMVAISVPVTHRDGRLAACLFCHAPVIRSSLEELKAHEPLLREAAVQLQEVLIDAEDRATQP